MDSKETRPTPTPLPLPRRLRVETAQARAELFERLSRREQALLGALTRAGTAGRPLLFSQMHRLAPQGATFFARAFSAEARAASRRMLGDAGYEALLRFAAKFHDHGGPYAPSNRKYRLDDVAPDALDALTRNLCPGWSSADRDAWVSLCTDPGHEPRCFPESPDGAGLEDCGGNHYERGLRGDEVRAALGRGLATTLNSRVGRGADGSLVAVRQTTALADERGRCLSTVVRHLRDALHFSERPEQRRQLEHTIAYFEKGDVSDFRAASAAWVRDRSGSTVDFMIGWVEVYEDWLARIGSWESYVQLVDPGVTRDTEKLARLASHFEARFPYGPWRKTFAPNWAPPAILVYYFQEIATYRSAGYNLPNFDDLRRDVGAKNVIRLPMPGEENDPSVAAPWEEVLATFALPEDRDTLAKYRVRAWRNLVLLHEVVGHGSGAYDASRFRADEDPVSGLGALGSALEEQRSDLAALFCLTDPAMVDAGLVASAEEGRRLASATYRFYLVDFLRRLSGQRSLVEAHQRGHWLFVSRALREGSIAWRSLPQGGQTLVVVDDAAFERSVAKLLEELQTIKALRDVPRLEALFATEAPLEAAEEPWARDIIARGEHLEIHGGAFEQPWTIERAGTNGEERERFVALGKGDLETSVAEAFRRVELSWTP
jgi:hypothetical protein